MTLDSVLSQNSADKIKDKQELTSTSEVDLTSSSGPIEGRLSETSKNFMDDVYSLVSSDKDKINIKMEGDKLVIESSSDLSPDINKVDKIKELYSRLISLKDTKDISDANVVSAVTILNDKIAETVIKESIGKLPEIIEGSVVVIDKSISDKTITELLESNSDKDEPVDSNISKTESISHDKAEVTIGDTSSLPKNETVEGKLTELVELSKTSQDTGLTVGNISWSLQDVAEDMVTITDEASKHIIVVLKKLGVDNEILSDTIINTASDIPKLLLDSATKKIATTLSDMSPFFSYDISLDSFAGIGLGFVSEARAVYDKLIGNSIVTPLIERDAYSGINLSSEAHWFVKIVPYNYNVISREYSEDVCPPAFDFGTRQIPALSYSFQGYSSINTEVELYSGSTIQIPSVKGKTMRFTITVPETYSRRTYENNIVGLESSITVLSVDRFKKGYIDYVYSDIDSDSKVVGCRDFRYCCYSIYLRRYTRDWKRVVEYSLIGLPTDLSVVHNGSSEQNPEYYEISFSIVGVID